MKPAANPDRRRSARRPLHEFVALRCCAESIVAGYARNISIGGMFIQTAPVPSAHERLLVWFEGLPTGHNALRAVVRWVSPQGIGVSFFGSDLGTVLTLRDALRLADRRPAVNQPCAR